MGNRREFLKVSLAASAGAVGRRDRSRRHKLHRKLDRQILSRNAAYL